MSKKLKISLTPSNQDRLVNLLDLVSGELARQHNREHKGSALHIRNMFRHPQMAERSRLEVSEEDGRRNESLAFSASFNLCNEPDNILSWKSHGEENVWAIRFLDSGLVAALAGFPPEDCEAALLWIGIRMSWITKEEACAAAARSRNMRFDQLLKDFDYA